MQIRHGNQGCGSLSGSGCSCRRTWFFLKLGYEFGFSVGSTDNIDKKVFYGRVIGRMAALSFFEVGFISVSLFLAVRIGIQALIESDPDY